MLVAAGVFALTACSDDNGSNPTLIQPTEFVLNEPVVKGSTIDLQHSTGIDLNWSQPNYTAENAPVVANYIVQVSTDGNFTKKYDEAADDNTGADYMELLNTSTATCDVTVASADLCEATQLLKGYDEATVPTSQELSFRILSSVSNASSEVQKSITSNVVKLTVVPYYIEMSSAEPIMWYLVGNMFGGKWGSDIGSTALPMFLIPDYEYDTKTGAGKIEYTNYFTTGDYDNTSANESSTSGFKIQPASFNWDYGFGGTNGGDKGKIVYRNGGDDGGHIIAPENGYYTVTVNTSDDTATMTKYEGDVKDYGTIQLSGSFNDWGDTPMLPYNTEGVENHAWYYVMTVTSDMYGDNGVCEFKFKIAGSWDTNWGFGSNDGALNTSGTCTNGGKNIGLSEGKYCISFNDITGAFSIAEL